MGWRAVCSRFEAHRSCNADELEEACCCPSYRSFVTRSLLAITRHHSPSTRELIAPLVRYSSPASATTLRHASANRHRRALTGRRRLLPRRAGQPDRLEGGVQLPPRDGAWRRGGAATARHGRGSWRGSMRRPLHGRCAARGEAWCRSHPRPRRRRLSRAASPACSGLRVASRSLHDHSPPLQLVPTPGRVTRMHMDVSSPSTRRLILPG